MIALKCILIACLVCIAAAGDNTCARESGDKSLGIITAISVSNSSAQNTAEVKGYILKSCDMKESKWFYHNSLKESNSRHYGCIFLNHGNSFCLRSYYVWIHLQTLSHVTVLIHIDSQQCTFKTVTFIIFYKHKIENVNNLRLLSVKTSHYGSIQVLVYSKYQSVSYNQLYIYLLTFYFRCHWEQEHP